ncbi:MAG: hypothetical protein AB1801_03725 [Chloroflexota bacterium]
MMHISDVVNITQARFFLPESINEPRPSDLNRVMQFGGSADLMSDLLYYNMSQSLIVTGLINPQTVRTAEMADAAAILIVRGKIPPPITIRVAWEVRIPLLGTQMTMFEACGRLYAAGLPPAFRLGGKVE